MPVGSGHDRSREQADQRRDHHDEPIDQRSEAPEVPSAEVAATEVTATEVAAAASPPPAVAAAGVTAAVATAVPAGVAAFTPAVPPSRRP